MTHTLHRNGPGPTALSGRARLLQQSPLGEGDLGGGASPQLRRQLADSEFTLGDPGACSGQVTTLHLVLDESPSVGGPGGNDPLSRRHDEAARAIAHVAAACTCRRERVVVVPFDQPSLGTVGPHPLTPGGLRRLKSGLVTAARTGGSSSLDPALARVEQSAARSPEHSAVVVFSDFLLTDTAPTQVLDRLAALPGYVHAVVLGARPPTRLLGHDHVAISVIAPSSPPGAVARAVFDGLIRYRNGGCH